MDNGSVSCRCFGREDRQSVVRSSRLLVECFTNAVPDAR